MKTNTSIDGQGLILLAERCEAATGPDRELDIAIWQVADPVNAAFCFAKGKRPLPWLHCYTASLDAAMMLVPEGWDVSLYLCEGMRPQAQIETEEMRRAVCGRFAPIDGGGATLALALCAAALRARVQP